MDPDKSLLVAMTSSFITSFFPYPSPFLSVTHRMALTGLGVSEISIREGRMIFISPRRNYLWKSPLQHLDSCGLPTPSLRPSSIAALIPTISARADTHLRADMPTSFHVQAANQ
ncbi:hypothetical protein H5410_021665 [Solanum commersonii]|uniref:Uncharacterized protein n=1 Tax=Solanum commersonii TaxID=4109 RepID=A0A9J5ZEW6_SOLCO|nr:hypothetical protein H5410_021665 [Solanum commersonii]